MGIITKEVEVNPRGKMIQYYKDKGYDAEYGKSLTVKTKDLPKNSHAQVNVLCDYCKNIICNFVYQNYRKQIDKFGDYACFKCASIHQEKSFIEKYGVKNPMQNEELKKKQQDSLMERFGVYTPLKNEELKKKQQDTSMERFGTKYPSQLPEIKEKAIQSNLKRFGVEYPSQSPEVRKKITDSYMLRYGCESPAQSPEVRAKMNKTLYKNGTQKASKQQRYLHCLFGGELNYNVGAYCVDICFPEEKVYIEYDGGGHLLNVETGRITIEEHNHKEMTRFYSIKQDGYKMIRIISQKDYLPSDEILLQMLSQARNYFSKTSHTWITYDIDNSIMINADNKDTGGVFFDYGVLRKIKEIKESA